MENEELMQDVSSNLVENEPDNGKKKVLITVIIVAVLCALILVAFIIKNVADRKSYESATAETMEEASVVEAGDLIYEPEKEFMVTPENVDQFITKLGAYTGVEVDVEKQELSDAEIEDYAKYVYSSYAQVAEDRVAEEGDIVVMNYVGTIDGVAFDGGTAEGAELELGSHSYIDGFEDGLIGVKAGEERVLNLKFPEAYFNTDLAGKDCVFTCNVTGVKPKFSDEGVKLMSNGEFDTVEAFLESVRADMEDYYSSDYENNYVFAVLNKVMDSSEYKEFPEELMNAQRSLVEDTYSQYAQYYGYADTDAYLASMGTSKDEIAESYSKQSIVFVKIALEQGLYPTREEIVDYYRDQASEYGFESAEELIEMSGEASLAEGLMIERVYDFILANN